jgi:hypothetical protein
MVTSRLLKTCWGISSDNNNASGPMPTSTFSEMLHVQEELYGKSSDEAHPDKGRKE